MPANRKVIHLICAARPNFMKIAPLYHALKAEPRFETKIVHTGQHYDINMSDVFFQDLELPPPDMHLGIGSGSHAEQTGKVMIAYEQLCLKERPDLTIVVGDVNSTAACTLAAAKLGIKTAHLEAGLRSFDRSMPEELNRIVTDALADLLWTPSPDADQNLLREGVAPEKIKFVGNIMIDALELIRPKLNPAEACQKLKVSQGDFALATFHRPSNVDHLEVLSELVRALIESSKLITIILPLHPRTRAKLQEFSLIDALSSAPSLRLTDPLSYREFMSLLTAARLAITDSGGIQEETTYLGIPCLTARENTERPITVSQGTNRLVKLREISSIIRSTHSKEKSAESKDPIRYWDGRAASRILGTIHPLLSH
ncbi:MAG: UDP-N-acetylglucosamine 2-epimerase (non-hydrolyzing) [Proteobacteria bacterium]|nr:MAG: UDP-N-acetylglucosamine 2-epimerase (non-hydrolyzing) [Pseudomonadota bacterium]